MSDEVVLSLYDNKEIMKYIKSKVKLDDVEEIRQNAILEVLKIKNYNEIKNIKNYYFKIVKNQIYKYYKKIEVLRNHEINTINTEIYEDEYNLIDLSDYKYLILRFIEQKSVYDISVIEKVSIAEVYRRINKDKERLKNDLFL